MKGEMHSCAFPRLLIVTSNTFDRFTGGGISLLSLFADWPREKIANIYFESRTPETAVCDRFYRVDFQERRGLNVILSSRMKNWIDAFSPDILYTTLGGLPVMRLVHRILQRHKRMSLVVDMKDDWPNSLYRGSLLSWWHQLAMKRELKALLRLSKLRYCISEAMRLEYEARYGMKFKTFQIPIETKVWSAHDRHLRRSSDRFRVLYMGTVDRQAQLKSLCDVAVAVSSLRQAGIKIQMEIYVPAQYTSLLENDLKDLSGVLLLEAPENKRAPQLLSGADLLVIPANFDTASLRYTQFSLPSKCAAYMISGTPVLVFGSPCMPVVRYAKEAGWALVVDDASQAALKEALLRLMQDGRLREDLVQRAREVVYRNHDAAVIRPHFQQALSLAAVGEGG